ncbi:uncharacterized protein Z519_10301 [Cladophialophora bantiana CBS 173.52]|uniref:Major facilitator superfamily (MFS) profile domain-containing protein n=1 Tax=Cladophialophora bantiana (strain ATCC 10958 / CBS 173.52 / CDC B-1940 / NIH 8579) TaxID=1442370 RepID=A0A0D2FQE5_CLAB1|nr:uncharacterized protein Z519_10301 [Cladophialophora bantiana CBS 173.52]KIW88817.1 hypothetical protein Z519_10301 [Cladophialophora bantiana CBS 173.52]
MDELKIVPTSDGGKPVSASLYVEHIAKQATQIPVSCEATQHIEGDAFLVDKHGRVRKLPVPSDDPSDPLRFRWWEKYAIVFCCCWFSTMGLSLASGLGSILTVFFKLYIPQGKTPNEVTYLLTVPALCIGLGNYIILPLSLAYGRRPIFLLSVIVLLAATIASATQNSYNGHLASRVFQGLATGASESLLPLMLTEVTFLHERGKIFGLYWTVMNILTSVLNLSSSYETAALGWRWYYWVFVITASAGLVFAVFGAFETRFSRPAANIDGRIVVTDDFGVTHFIPDDQVQEYYDRLGIESSPGGPTPCGVDGTATRTTYLQKLKPWSTPHPQPLKTILLSWTHMLQAMTSPGILYSVLISSIALGCSVDLSLSYDSILQGQYGWKPQNIGLINVGSVVGSFIGTAYCTLFGEKLVMWLAKRNRGVHRPEHRLVVLALPAALAVAMLVLYGSAAEGGSSYWGTVISYSLYQSSFICVLIVSTTFAAEASSKHPGPALVVVVGTKNIVSFGATYGFTPMVNGGGYYWAYGVLAGIFGAISLLGIPVYLLNPKWRDYMTKRDEKHGVTSSD